MKGMFYKADLQTLHVSDDALFRIQKVLKRQKDRVLVKWKGWPDKYSSCISSQDVTTLQRDGSKNRPLVRFNWDPTNGKNFGPIPFLMQQMSQMLTTNLRFEK